MTQTDEDVRKLVDRMTKSLVDQGRLIEAGWMAMRVLTIPKSAPQNQLDDMRMAFYTGAQHLWACINGMVEPGVEPTPLDLKRMDAIDTELRNFAVAMKALLDRQRRGARPQ